MKLHERPFIRLLGMPYEVTASIFYLIFAIAFVVIYDSILFNLYDEAETVIEWLIYEALFRVPALLAESQARLHALDRLIQVDQGAAPHEVVFVQKRFRRHAHVVGIGDVLVQIRVGQLLHLGHEVDVLG